MCGAAGGDGQALGSALLLLSQAGNRSLSLSPAALHTPTPLPGPHSARFPASMCDLGCNAQPCSPKMREGPQFLVPCLSGTRRPSAASSLGCGAGTSSGPLVLESTWTCTSGTARCCLTPWTGVPGVMGWSDDVAAFAQPSGPVRGTARCALGPPQGTGDVTQLGANDALQVLVSQLGCCSEGQEEVGCCILFILTIKDRAGVRNWFN